MVLTARFKIHSNARLASIEQAVQDISHFLKTQSVNVAAPPPVSMATVSRLEGGELDYPVHFDSEILETSFPDLKTSHYIIDEVCFM
jgi:hypothetical protein